MRLWIATIVLLAASSPALAHRLHVVPKIVGDELRVEAFYDDDTPAQEARIAVLFGDEIVAQGTTDDKGVWTCPRLKAGTYLVKAESVGHAARETLVVDAGPAKPDQSLPAIRQQRTQMPWARLAAGLGLIGGLYVAWLIARRALGRNRGDLTS